MFRYSVTSLLAVVLITALGCSPRADVASRGYTVNIQFVNYIQAGLSEQDVFVEPQSVRDNIPSEFLYPLEPCYPRDDVAADFMRPCVVRPYVVRAEPENAQRPNYLSKELYAANRVIPHDPYKVGMNPLGPFPKGDALGVTLREWLAASGSGTYAVKDDRAELNLSFHRLVPNGTYSLWCGRETPPPEYTSVDVACGAADGSHSSFEADAAGEGTLHLKLRPLPGSTNEASSELLLSYDRDAGTSDEDLGGYGLNNHVQLFFNFPKASTQSNLITNLLNGQ